MEAEAAAKLVEEAARIAGDPEAADRARAVCDTIEKLVAARWSSRAARR